MSAGDGQDARGRVLHLLSVDDGHDACALVRACMAEQQGHELVAMGRGAREVCAAFGLRPARVLGGAGAHTGQHRLLAGWAGALPGRFGLAVAWGLRASDLARAAWPRTDSLLCLALDCTGANHGAWRAMVHGALAPVAHAWGLGAGVTLPPPVPAVHSREALRASLGLSAHEVAVLLLADPPSAGDARAFAQQVGVLTLADVRSVGLMHACSTGAARGVRHARAFDFAWDMITTIDPLHTLLPACDVALWHQGESEQFGMAPDDARTGGGAVLATHALLHGVPVLAVDSPLARTVLGEPGTGWAVAQNTLPAWSAVLVPLCLEASRRQDLVQRCAAQARGLVGPVWPSVRAAFGANGQLAIAGASA